MARKGKKRRRSRGLLVIAAIALLIAGFVARRLMVPQLMHALTYRAPDHQDSANPGDAASDEQRANPKSSPDENISEHDRRALDDLIKQKSH